MYLQYAKTPHTLLFAEACKRYCMYRTSLPLYVHVYCFNKNNSVFLFYNAMNYQFTGEMETHYIVIMYRITG